MADENDPAAQAFNTWLLNATPAEQANFLQNPVAVFREHGVQLTDEQIARANSLALHSDWLNQLEGELLGVLHNLGCFFWF